MILKEKDYEILASVLQPWQMQTLLNELHSDKNISSLAIQTKDWSLLEHKSLSVSSSLYRLDSKIFEELCNKFTHRDFAYDLYTLIYEEYRGMLEIENMPIYGSYNYLRYTKNIADVIAKGRVDIKSDKWHGHYQQITKMLCLDTRQACHPKALKMITLDMDDRDFVLSAFKIFTQKNKAINPQAKKHMDKILETIKDWDLSQHFKKNEIVLLYGQENGFVAEKIEGLFFKIDVNLVKQKNKSSNKLIITNIKNLLGALPEALGDVKGYMGVLSKIEEPLIEFTLMLKSEQNYVDNLKNFIEETIESKTQLDKDDIKSSLKAICFSANLQEELETKDKTSMVRKAKI